MKGFVRCRHLQASAGIDSMVFFFRCRQLQASAGIDSMLVSVTSRHLQASAGIAEPCFLRAQASTPRLGFLDSIRQDGWGGSCAVPWER